MKINLIKKHNLLMPYDTDAVNKIDSFKEGAIYQCEIKNMDIRSVQQNKSLWKWCDLISHELNSNNMYISDTIKSEVEWNKDSVKTLIFNPVMKALYNKDSSTKLEKKDFDKIIDTITNIFANKGVVIPEFPNKNKVL